MVNDSEAVVLTAFPSWSAWAEVEAQPVDGWRKAAAAMGGDWRRSLLVDAPLSPLRTGRQPQVEDRRSLDEL